MNKERLFVAIDLPAETKRSLCKYKGLFPEIPAKWVPQSNIHITLLFLGLVDRQKKNLVIESMKKVSLEESSFDLKIDRVAYDTLNKESPRMIWAFLNESENLLRLKKSLDMAIKNQKIKDFIPHITLARIKEWQFKRVDLFERPEIDQEEDLSFNVSSIDLMQSKIKKEGPQYCLLEKFYLNKKR